MAAKLIQVTTFRPDGVEHVAPLLAFGLAQHGRTVFAGYPPEAGGRLRACQVAPDHRTFWDVPAAVQPVEDLLAELTAVPDDYYWITHRMWSGFGRYRPCDPELIRAAAANHGAKWIVADLARAPRTVLPHYRHNADLTLHLPENIAGMLASPPEETAFRPVAAELASWTRALLAPGEPDFEGQ